MSQMKSYQIVTFIPSPFHCKVIPFQVTFLEEKIMRNLVIFLVVICANFEYAALDGERDTFEKEVLQKLALLEKKQDSCENRLADYEKELSMNRQLLANVSQVSLPNFAPRTNRAAGESVAFYAYMSADRCIGSHEVFVFDKEVTDIGGGYNSLDGIFDVPISGTYVFTFTVFGMNHNYIRAELVVGGQVKNVILADADEINDYHTATATAVLQVNAGDHVFVRRSDSYSECNVLSNFGRALTTFSGWLLF